MRRTVRGPSDVQAWLASPTCAALLRFLARVCAAARGRPVDYGGGRRSRGAAAAGEEEAFLNPAVEEGFPVIIIIAVGAFLSSPSRSARALFRGAPHATAVQFSYPGEFCG